MERRLGLRALLFEKPPNEQLTDGDTIEDRPKGLEGKAFPEKCVRFPDGSFMWRGSLMCRHGFEAGKKCDICYDEWKKRNDLYT